MSRRWRVALFAAGAVAFLAALVWFLRPAPPVISPREQAQEAGQKFATALATDPGAALARLRALPPGAECGAALQLWLAALHRRDADAALALARELVVTREQAAIYSVLLIPSPARIL